MKSILSIGNKVSARRFLFQSSKVITQKFTYSSKTKSISKIAWPANTKLEPITYKNHFIRFEPVTEDDIPALVTLIREILPNEPCFRATGAVAALEAAKKNPESLESAEFLKQSRALIYSLCIYPGLASRPHVSFKVFATNNSNSVASREEKLIGVVLSHIEYIGPEGSCYSYLYANFNLRVNR